MISRYSREKIAKIWQPENKYKIWLDIEIFAAEAMEKFKIIPKGVVKKVKSKAKINVDRILKIEESVKHDVIAFLTSITERAGKEARFLHKGMTSSDVLDTCFNLQLKQSGEIILNDIKELLKSIKKQAIKHKMTLCIGRSHGIHAEPITFGFKMLTFYQEFLRNKKRLETGMIFTIEPMINEGDYDCKMLNDGWTAVTKDKKLSAQFEHTVGITDDGYEIFTKSKKGLDHPPYSI